MNLVLLSLLPFFKEKLSWLQPQFYVTFGGDREGCNWIWIQIKKKKKREQKKTNLNILGYLYSDFWSVPWFK